MELEPTLSRSDALLAESQRLLAEFIQREIQLGTTFTEIALVERDLGNIQHSQKAKRDAQAALETVRRFSARLTHSEARVLTTRLCADLESRIASL